MNLPQLFLIALLRIYRVVISPILSALTGSLGMGCRFTPTCSQYALEAIRSHGALRGSWLSLNRLARCHPWGKCGHDPVPAASPAMSGRHPLQPKHFIAEPKRSEFNPAISSLKSLGHGS